jgi:hypothetical protein
MFSPELRQLVTATNRSMRMIWFYLTVSILVYVPVAYYVGGRNHGQLSEAAGWALAAGAVALAMASLLYRRVGLSHEALRAGLSKPLPASSMALEKLQSLSEAERRVAAAVTHMQTPLIVCLALNEGIALLGLVLALMSDHPQAVLPFAAAAIALNALIFPNIEREAEQLWTRAQLGPDA